MEHWLLDKTGGKDKIKFKFIYGETKNGISHYNDYLMHEISRLFESHFGTRMEPDIKESNPVYVLDENRNLVFTSIAYVIVEIECSFVLFEMFNKNYIVLENVEIITPEYYNERLLNRLYETIGNRLKK